MEQPISTPCGSNTYPNMMEMPGSLPLRNMSNSPTTPDTHQQSFDGTSFFGDVPQEILNYPVTMVPDSSLDPWLMELPGTASPGSSRLSMSPSQGITTPSSDGFYSPSYPQQLQLPAYHFIEQPQPLRSCSTSHPNWVGNSENWVRNHAESEIWTSQPFAAQPWLTQSYDGYTSSYMTTENANLGASASAFYTYTPQNQFELPGEIQTTTIDEARRSSIGSDINEDDESSDSESDWDDEASTYSQTGSSESRPKLKIRPSRPHIDRWSVSIPNVQQSEIRGHLCSVPGCTTAFVRPEHLRRHVRSKHMAERVFACKVPDCRTAKFSRGDNLRDHYWTHLDRGGRAGKNKKYTFKELREILGPKEKKLMRRLREKQRQHLEKEKHKKQRVTQPAFSARSML